MIVARHYHATPLRYASRYQHAVVTRLLMPLDYVATATYRHAIAT